MIIKIYIKKNGTFLQFLKGECPQGGVQKWKFKMDFSMKVGVSSSMKVFFSILFDLKII